MRPEGGRSLSRGDSCCSFPCLCRGRGKQFKLSFDIELEKQLRALEREAEFFSFLLLLLEGSDLAKSPASSGACQYVFGLQPCR